MSLTIQQKENTKRELRENLQKSGLTYAEVAADLQTSEAYLQELMALRPRRLDDPWILGKYLYEKAKEAGAAPTEYTALRGSPRNYWFLDADYIEAGIIGIS